MHTVASSRWPWGKAGATPRSGITMDLCPPMTMALLLVFTNVFTKISKCVLLQPLHFSLVLSTVPPQLIIFTSSERQLFIFWMHECHFLWNFVVTLTLNGDKNSYLSHIRVIYWRLSAVVITGILGSSHHCSCCFAPDSGFQKQPFHLYFSIPLLFLLIPCRLA